MEIKFKCRKGFESLVKDLEGVMFDLDGTLIDSIPVYMRIAAAMLERVGLPPAPREAVAAMLKQGLPGFHHLIPKEMSHRKEELIEACIKAGKEIAGQLYPDSVSLIPGVRELFHRLDRAGVRIGIVSSSQKEYIQKKLLPLKQAGIDSLVGSIIVIEDTSEIKPSPEPVTACAGRLRVEEGRSLFVGDTDIDVLAGKRAGTFTVGVLTGVDDYETLLAQRPNMILPGVRELIPLF
jgi:HAD superfamily hydrolase (TIGR01549 family)